MAAFKLSGLTGKLHKNLKLLLSGAVITLLIATVQIFQPLLLELFNGKIYDVTLNAVHSPQTTGVPIVIDVDEKSLEELGQWPWPRYRVAVLLEKLKALGVASVGIDFLFSEADRSSPRAVQSDLKSDFGADVTWTGVPEDLQDYDYILGETLKRGPFVLGYKFFDGTPAKSEDCILHPVNLAWLDSSGAQQNADFPESSTVLCNHRELAGSALFAGFFNATPDRDGVYRKVPLIVKYDGGYHASLSLAAFLMSRDTNQVVAVRDAQGLVAIRAGGVTIPIDNFGNMLIHYRGEAKTFQTISAASVYYDRVPAQELSGKVAFLGTSSAGLMDIRTTPLDPIFPGVEVHANAVDNMIAGDFYKRPYWMPGAELLVLLAVALGTILCLVYARTFYGLILVTLEMVLLVIAAGYILQIYGLFFSPLMPLIACVTIFSTLTLLKFRMAEVDKDFLHNAFSKFVSGEVVEELVKSPEQLKLSGEAKQLTVLFLDIRGFTGISEKLTPQEVGELLNDFFTPMTAVIKQHGGTLDKYIGDSIMAFWNAPLAIRNHPTKAVRACLGMISGLVHLKQQFLETYGVTMRVGIGLHSGEAMVGNMGSSDLFNYTALGDTVNLASRVEGLTKRYGVPLLVTESVVAGCNDESIVFWEIDRVLVVGKQEPEKIFYALDKTDHSALEQEIAGYAAAYHLYLARDFATADKHFTALAEHSPFPRLHKQLADRCKRFTATPPPADWAGVHRLGSN
ncbi:MAG: adenylate/guanylate cyclase domain-containing protein [Gammaproteobacteria bacterium]|nr:adenylate/guanylate cyclase domain-containing protein [Gammaproteobacteria bacterium]